MLCASIPALTRTVVAPRLKEVALYLNCNHTASVSPDALQHRIINSSPDVNPFCHLIYTIGISNQLDPDVIGIPSAIEDENPAVLENKEEEKHRDTEDDNILWRDAGSARVLMRNTAGRSLYSI